MFHNLHLYLEVTFLKHLEQAKTFTPSILTIVALYVTLTQVHFFYSFSWWNFEKLIQTLNRINFMKCSLAHTTIEIFCVYRHVFLNKQSSNFVHDKEHVLVHCFTLYTFCQFWQYFHKVFIFAVARGNIFLLLSI